jgi:ATP-binding cassette subfamily B protein AbcA/BmrA
MMEEESKEGNGVFKRMFGAGIKYSLADSLMASFITLTNAGILVVTFIIGSQQVASGQLTTGVVVAFYGIAMMASIRISVLITVYGTFVESNGVFKKISQVLVAEEESNEGYPLDMPDEDIYFKNVHFSYDKKQVLKGFDCVIPNRKITAVIGNNGAGKTTIFKLLSRMYVPSEGQILFGTTPADDFDLHSWRKAFAMVAQDRPLLSGTIRDNITYGCDRQISDKELEQVAQQANIWDLIKSLPEGFDAQVGPNGSNFSGGQRQCIAIARAIMRNPDYLLLDEATSNLDAQSEKMVSIALENLMKDRTTLIIGHSLSSIRNADNIIVLRDGKLDSCGAPQEVFKTSETYRKFVLSQCKVNAD